MGATLQHLDGDHFTLQEKRERTSTTKVGLVQAKAVERCVNPGVDERFDLHRRGGKVGREAVVLSWQSVEMPLEWRGRFSKANIQTF